MKIRCLVADDEPIARQIVEGYIEKIPFLEWVGSCKDAFEVIEKLRNTEVELLFLDINMPRLNGLSLLRSMPKKPNVILTTAYKEYALEGFELAVTDYLLKPFSFARFLQAVQKVEEKIKPLVNAIPGTSPPQTPNFIFVKVDRQMVKVRLDDILYVAAWGNYIKIHLKEKALVSLQTLSQFKERLPEQDFLQIHKSHIINFKHLEIVDGNQAMINQEWLSIGKAYRINLKERLNEK